MPFTDLTIRLLILFFPGIICHFIVDALTVHRERRLFQVVLFGYVYGVLSYVVYAILHALFHSVLGVFMASIANDGALDADASGTGVSLFSSITDSTEPLNFSEIAIVTVIAVVLAFVLTFASQQKWLHRMAASLRVTKKFGDANVWSLALNSPDIRWAVVRDLKNGLMFAGYIRAFSDVEDEAELLLTDVIVYNEVSGDEVYRAARVYLARPKDDLTVEFPNPPTEQAEPIETTENAQ
jgi:hypothetical protein